METLNMRSRLNRATALIACATMGAIFYFAAIRTTGQATRIPRTPDGHPNLNGIWQATTTANWDLLAHTMRPAVAQPGVYPDVPVLAPRSWRWARLAACRPDLASSKAMRFHTSPRPPRKRKTTPNTGWIATPKSDATCRGFRGPCTCHI